MVPSAEVSGDETDKFEVMISMFEESNRTTVENQNTYSKLDFVRNALTSFQLNKRVDSNNNVLQYWQKESINQPHLFMLAQIVLAVSRTQVSVERLFSGIKYIMTYLRRK